MTTLLRGPDDPVDAQEVARALALLIERGATFELRALPSKRSWIGTDPEAAGTAARDLGARDNLYYTLNPCRTGLASAAKNADVLARRWLLVDCDCHHGDRPADDTERRAAWEVSESVRDDLAARGWPAPLVVDSGNGIQLLYRCDLANSPLANQWVAGLLRNLAARHSTDYARVDTSVHNAGRIARLPGTWNRKGTPEPDIRRYHRPAVFLSVPDPVEVVPADLIRRAASRPEPARRKARIRLNVPATTPAEAWFRAAIDREADRVANATPGTRHNTLRAAVRSLAGRVHLGYFVEADVKVPLADAARRAGLDTKEVEDVILWAIEDGRANPLPWPENLERPGPRADRNGSVRAEAAEPEDPAEETHTGHSGRSYAFPLVVRGREVEPRRVEWLWQDRVPYGFLTLLAGRTGVGKSFVALDVAARLTAGEEIPGGAGECFEPGSCLIIGEDSHEYVLVPRLLEAGADMDRIAFMSWQAMVEYSLANAEMLDDTYHAAGCPRLVIIDPPTNFLGGKDGDKHTEVRSVLMIVSIWAMSNDVAVVMITHNNKGSKRDLAALDRIIGSVAWASTSRIAHLLAPHPDEDGQGVFLPLKSNIGRLPRGLAYRIVSTPTLARVEWLGEVDVDADDALGGREKKPRGIVAVEWLTERFRERREWPSDELVATGREAGVSRDALFSPEANALPIRKRPSTAADGSRQWHWIAEPGWPPIQNP